MTTTTAQRHKVRMEEAARFDEFRRLAATMVYSHDMRQLTAYSAYLQGARMALLAFADEFPQIFKGKEAVYNKAIVRLATASLRGVDLYLSKEYEIHFRNHEHDKRGKCVKCEAYFAQRVTVDREVR